MTYVHVYKRMPGKRHITNKGLRCWCKPIPHAKQPNLLLHRVA